MGYLVCDMNLITIPPKRIQNHISSQALVQILNETLNHTRPLLVRARQITKQMELRTNLERRAVDRLCRCTLAVAEVGSGGEGSGAGENEGEMRGKGEKEGCREFKAHNDGL